MNFKLKITGLKSIKEIAGYWNNDDYINLLEAFDYTDAKNSQPDELLELLGMACSDLEPDESAEIMLRYHLQNQLNEGQIQNLSHAMIEDDESDENSNIALHYPLFNITQLLRKCYNGVFPSAKATEMDIELELKPNTNNVSKEMVLKAVSQLLTSRSPVVRLFEAQLSGKERFSDADHVIWELRQNGQNQYTIITSDYWINAEDIAEDESSGSIKFHE
jgi:predicted protein tyrosine phosphatase